MEAEWELSYWWHIFYQSCPLHNEDNDKLWANEHHKENTRLQTSLEFHMM